MQKSAALEQVPGRGAWVAVWADGEDERAADLLQRKVHRRQRAAPEPRGRRGQVGAGGSVSDKGSELIGSLK